MREAGSILREIFSFSKKMVYDGYSFSEIDSEIGKALKLYGAKSGLLLQGFPGNMSYSIDYEVIQGLPDNRKAQIGDLVSLDMTLYYGGFFVDKATTFLIPPATYEKHYLVSSINKCLSHAIQNISEEITLGQFGRIIDTYVRGLGLRIAYQFSGHMIGEQPHMEPLILNFDDGSNAKVPKDSYLCIEPVIMYDNYTIEYAGETTVKANVLSAHAEETVYLSSGRVEVIT